MKSDLITIEVVVNGRAVKHYTHDGKTYIEAKAGTQYELKVRNATDARILAVVSVDGLNVVTGERATPEDIGYLVPAYGSLPIKGFRYSDEEVGAFKFVTKESSYNAKMGEDTSNVGVIGLLAFEDLDEKNRRIRQSQMLISARQQNYSGSTIRRRSLVHDPGPTTKGIGGQSAGTSELYSADFSTTPCSMHDGFASNDAGPTTMDFMEFERSYEAPTSRRLLSTPTSLPVKHNVGTGWGDKIQQACTHTTFTKGAQLVETVMFYSSREALIESGVIDPNPTVKIPSAFAKTYAIPPPGFIRG